MTHRRKITCSNLAKPVTFECGGQPWRLVWRPYVHQTACLSRVRAKPENPGPDSPGGRSRAPKLVLKDAGRPQSGGLFTPISQLLVPSRFSLQTRPLIIYLTTGGKFT